MKPDRRSQPGRKTPYAVDLMGRRGAKHSRRVKEDEGREKAGSMCVCVEFF